MESSSRYPFGLLRATRCLWDSSMLCVIVFVYSHRCVVVHVQVLIIYYVTPLPIDIWVVSIFGPRQIVLLQTAFGCIFILFFFFWLGSSLGVELLSWAFVVISKWFSKMIVPIYTSVNSVCFTSSPTLYNLPFFILSILRNWCELVSHCGFNSHFSDGEWCWAVFHVLIGRVSMLFCEVPVHVFSPFSTGLFLLFLMDL